MAALHVVVSIWIQPGRMMEFESFERKAFQIMSRHGGTAESVIRIASQTPSLEGQPFEMHVLTFPSVEAFNAYRGDPELLDLAKERNAAISRAEVLFGTEGPQYAS
jgi:uncharacterized protein (DUF1330 family)